MEPSLDSKSSQTVNASHAEVYQTLSTIFDFKNEDERLWWHSTAPMFAQMLQLSNRYDPHSQYKFLGLYKKFVIPYLRDYPIRGRSRWMSILTRYGTPFELSLNCSDSVVRFTYEPINSLTGTEHDPFNTHAIWDALRQLLPLQRNINLEWFRHFKRDLTLSTEESALLEVGMIGNQIRTQNKLALDLQPDGGFVLKTYIYPALKSLVTGKSIHDLIFESTYELSKACPGISAPLSTLEEYIRSRGPNSTASPRLISCDLVDSSQSRIKIYLLEQMVSLPAVEDLWTLGGRRRDSSTLAGLELLRELWGLINLPTGLRDYPTGYLPLGAEIDEQLPLMVNFTLHQNDPIPEPQVYLTTFGMNDKAVANSLITFFARHGWDEMARSYAEQIRSY